MYNEGGMKLKEICAIVVCGCLVAGEETGLSTLRISEKGCVVAQLDNGLVVLLKELRTAPIVDVRVFVKTGSMYEANHLGTGISHLFEHLIHGGTTKTRSEAEIGRLLRRLGGASNAYTSQNRTVFYITTSSEHFGEAIDLLADWMANCSITEREFQRERGVVLREMESAEDNPFKTLFRLTWLNVFLHHPVRHPVIGYPELFKKLTLGDVLKYYETRYVPNNMLVVAAGDFDWKDALEKIKSSFGAAERGTPPTIVLPTEPPQTTKRYIEKPSPFKAVYLTVSFRTIPLSHPDLYPLDLIAYILSQGRSSRLQMRLKFQQGLVDEIGAWSLTPEYDAGLFTVFARTRPEKKDKALSGILEEVYRFKFERVSSRELKRAKVQKRVELLDELKTASSLASRIAVDYLSTGDPDFSYKYVERIERVKKGEIIEVAKKYFKEGNCTVVALTPKEKTIPRPPLKAKAGKVLRDVLPNGLKVLLRRDSTLPLVTMQAYFLAGVRVESEENSGITNLMSRVLLRGSRHYSARQIGEAFDSVGGSIEAGSGNNTFFLTAEVPSEAFKRCFKVFCDVLLNPTFPEREIERARALLLASIQQRSDDPQAQAELLFRKTIFRSSPYRKDYLGSVRSVKKISRDDLVKFWRKWTSPDRGVIAIFGDIELEETRDLIRRAFRGLKPSPAVMPSVPEPPISRARIRIEKTNKQNAIVYFGFLGPNYKSLKERAVLQVLDAIISGIGYPSGWLHSRLRGQKLVYEVHAYPFAGLDTGYFAGYAVTSPDKANKVIDEFKKAFQRIREGKISPEELQLAKDICRTMSRLRRQTNSQLASQSSLDELYGVGYGASEKLSSLINSVTIEEIKALALKYFRGYALVVVTPQAKSMGQTKKTSGKSQKLKGGDRGL